MINISFEKKDVAKPLSVLCLGCHSDDIEIGCGGTILRLLEQSPSTTFHWVVFSAIGVRQDEARRAAKSFVAADNLQGPYLHEFADGFMPFNGAEIKNVFERLKREVSPDLVLTHNRMDSHQDHRLIAELTWNTFRDHLILEYEIPKYDGDLGQPIFYVPLTQELCEKKVRYLMEAFDSQRNKRWFEESTFRALMRLRGMECNSGSGYAEAFYCRKICF
jgi:LmbE family N-acetylglucosaminyl deacetylase